MTNSFRLKEEIENGSWMGKFLEIERSLESKWQIWLSDVNKKQQGWDA